jgi:hypothetical protein
MGIKCKPIGKLASLHRKIENEQLKEKAEKTKKEAKKADK